MKIGFNMTGTRMDMLKHTYNPAIPAMHGPHSLVQTVRAVHSCNSWLLGPIWSDSVVKLVSVLFGKSTTLVATKC